MASWTSRGAAFLVVPFLFVLLTVSPCSADAPGPKARTEERPPFATYGLPILLMDLAATATFIGGLQLPVEKSSGMTSRDQVLVGSMISYALDGPTVHAIHGNGRRAALSLGIRLGGPMVTTAIGYLVGAVMMIPGFRISDRSTHCEGCSGGGPAPYNVGPDYQSGGAVVGFAVGAVGAMLVDQLLGRRPLSAAW